MAMIPSPSTTSTVAASTTVTSFHLEPMRQSDVGDVSRVERRCFSNPWPASAYRRELRNRIQNYYVVLRAIPSAYPPADDQHDGPAPRRLDGGRMLSRFSLLHLPRRGSSPPDGPHIAGFAGMWIMFNEAHVTTIGVDPLYRGRGFGELLLIGLIDESVRRGATWLTLEVRVSNTVAQALYRKYGFSIQGSRTRYYSDDGEDAYIMGAQSLRDPAYLRRVDALRRELADRLAPRVAVPDSPRGPFANRRRFDLDFSPPPDLPDLGERVQ